MILTKICSKCKIKKPLKEFVNNKSNPDGKSYYCKICNQKIQKIYKNKNQDKIKKQTKKYYENNKEKEQSRRNLYRENNKEQIKEKNKLYRETNKERIKEKKKLYRANNKDKIKITRDCYIKIKKETDILFVLKYKIRRTISNIITKNGYTKKSKATDILGCSFIEFKQHLESKFEPWMNWDNHGLYNGELNYGWDMDHIIPMSSAKTEEDVIRLNHYTNFQPLCSYTNRFIKRDNY